MQANEALSLVQHWGEATQDHRLIGRLQVDADGSFRTHGAGAFFRYGADDSMLRVSGLVRYDITILSEFPELWADLVQAGAREHTTLGDGQFELYREQLFHLAPDVVLLSKTYGEMLDADQFATEVRWLLQGAHYWRMKRFNDVQERPGAQLAQEADRINATWPRRPW